MNTLEEFENDALDAHARTAVAETQRIASGSTRPSVADLLHTTTAERGSNAKKWGIGLAALSAAAAAIVGALVVSAAGDGPRTVRTAITAPGPTSTVPAPTSTVPGVKSVEVLLPGNGPTGLQRGPCVSVAKGVLWYVDSSGVVHGFDLVRRVELVQFPGGAPTDSEVRVAALPNGVAVVSSGRIAHFDSAGTLVNEIAAVNTPLAVHADGNTLWVAETTGSPEAAPKHSLGVYDLERGVRTGTTSIPNSDPDAPEGITAFIAAVDGRPYVAVEGVVYRAEGSIATRLTAADRPVGQIVSNGSTMFGVRGAALGENGDEVVRIDPSSGALAVISRTGYVDELAVDDRGRLWWVETNKPDLPVGFHIVRANLDGTTTEFGPTAVGYGNNRFGALVAEGDSAILVGLSSVQFVNR